MVTTTSNDVATRPSSSFGFPWPCRCCAQPFQAVTAVVASPGSVGTWWTATGPKIEMLISCGNHEIMLFVVQITRSFLIICDVITLKSWDLCDFYVIFSWPWKLHWRSSSQISDFSPSQDQISDEGPSLHHFDFGPDWNSHLHWHCFSWLANSGRRTADEPLRIIVPFICKEITFKFPSYLLWALFWSMCFSVVFVREHCFVAQGAFPSSPTLCWFYPSVSSCFMVDPHHQPSSRAYMAVIFPFLINMFKTCWNTHFATASILNLDVHRDFPISFHTTPRFLGMFPMVFTSFHQFFWGKNLQLLPRQLMSTTLDGDGVDFVGLRPLLQRIDAVLQGQEKEARPRHGIWMLQRYRKGIDKYNINYVV